MKKVLFDVKTNHYCPEDLAKALSILHAGREFGDIESFGDVMFALSVFQDYSDTFHELFLDVFDLAPGPFDISGLDDLCAEPFLGNK